MFNRNSLDFETNRFHWSSLSATPNKKELQVWLNFWLEAVWVD